MNASLVNTVGAVLFAVAILHTFSVRFFERLAQAYPRHAGLLRLLGEVEVVFGFWSFILLIFMTVVTRDQKAAVDYLDSRSFTEPMFVFTIMVVAASKPIMQVATAIVDTVAKFIPFPHSIATYFALLGVVPLLGSFITEPAAMTLAAFMLKSLYYDKGLSRKLRYVTIGTLFVNISIGGTLTNFAAPPILMVAHKWDWSTWFMLSHLGWKSAVAVFLNAGIATLIFHKELLALKLGEETDHQKAGIPVAMLLVHVLILFMIVRFSHDTPVFMGFFMLFMGIASAYPHYQERLILREGLMVGFFLAGLVVLGGLQEWWLRPLLHSMDATAVYFGATVLTAVTDNAALTYLGSLVDGLSPEFKYSLVAGAVTGGGLTVIANAPNPAGMSILRGNFEDKAVNPVGLFIAAAPPTLTAILAFQVL
ncbi:MAG: putative Na+/H+ antiporter [Zoogloeaceae bacterium]|jgi:hypothetical protein|nr:putative Na+/H+ antiporter [Zoogloeaceae bacterium]